MLDELVDTIRTLKQRITEHRGALQTSEAQTRLSLIDPLLRALGWDTADPALVRPEYTLTTGRADYALLGASNQPVAIMEAKKLNEPLGNAEHRMQMLTYANFSNVAYAGLTDGDQWVFYRVFDQKPLPERVVLEVSIVNEESAKAALKLLLLWHPNLASGHPIAAPDPIAGTESPKPSPPPPDQTNGNDVTPQLRWVSLKNLVVAAGATPRSVYFPNDDELHPTSWRGLLIGVAEWLIKTDVLTQDRCPIATGRNPAYCSINLQPIHPDGSAMFGAHTLSNGLSLASHGSAQAVIDRCKGILTRLGRDPATINVLVGNE